MLEVGPSDEVLDLFAVPGVTARLGGSVVAGDLVLSPGRDAAVQEWLSPTLARLAVTMDTRPGRDPRDLRIAVPVPARDGSWVVDGWGASRYEPDTVHCTDLDVTLAAGRVLHAELASWVRTRPAGLSARTDRHTEAERVAFGEAARLVDGLAAEVSIHLAPYDDHPAQLVHADLMNNVLLDAYGAPVVIDVAPAWRPVRWAEAVCVLDAVVRGRAPLSVLGSWTSERDRQAMLRALLFRLLSDPADAGLAPGYALVLAALV
jgi:hypothetical protein